MYRYRILIPKWIIVPHFLINFIRRKNLPRMLHQLYFPADPDRRMKTLALADALLRGTRLYALQCRPDAAAAELSCRTLCGSLPE